MKRILLLIPLLFVFLWSCNYADFQPVPDDVKVPLDSAKENKSELLKVINHYRFNPKDSLNTAI